jgi:HAE1 family hydrophobic/amphiphilic exporter-1
MKITEYSLRRPVTVLMIFLSVIVIGIIASRMIPLEFFPEMEYPYVNVNIPYPNSTPEEIERQITRPVEEILATIGDIKKMRSNSNENDCNIGLEFEWSVNSKIKAIEAKEKIDSIRDQLPIDLERVYIGYFNASDIQLMTIRISSNRDLSNSYDMLNRHLKRRIERIRGVSRVNLYGAEKKEIRIQLLANRIIAHQVDLSLLAQVLSNYNFILTAGKITDANRRFTVRPIGEIKTIEEIENLIIGENNLKLRDIAKISYEVPELDYGRHLNRRYAVGLDIYKEAGANIVNVANRVKEELTEISKDPKMEGITLYLMHDSADAVTSSLNELLKSGLIGAVLALIMLYFFLRQWSTTFIVALAVPFSLLVALAFMYFFKTSLNILSMLGLLLAVGMLVDNAVVVTENIYRHQRKNPNKKRATLTAVKEVALAITAGTSTTAIVFLPNILTEKSQITIQVTHVAVSFCIALGASLILAQTVVPLLTSRIKSSVLKKKATIIDRLISFYTRILTWTMYHRKISVTIILFVLFSVAIPFSFVKKDMFPAQDNRILRLYYNVNDTYTVEKVEAAVDKIEEYLYSNKKKLEIESVYTYYTGDYAESTILLLKGKEASKPQEQIKNKIRDELPIISIGEPSFERRRSGGSSDALRIQLNGPSTEQLTILSHQVASELEKIPGFIDVRSEASVGKREVHVVVDRERARKIGYTSQEIARNIEVAMRGVNLRRIQGEEGEILVRVEYQKDDKKTLNNLQDLTLFRNNQPVKLASLADFKLRHGPRSIRRENRITSIGVSIDLKDITVNEAKEKISQRLDNFNFPSGYSWSYGSSFDFEQETIRTMMINTLLALALIYIVMASLFESLVFPGAIWTSIIFAIIGVWWFFLFTATTFDLMAWFGVLILIGVVVNNGIVLIDHINHLRAKGLLRHKAIVQAGGDRLRPILMTAGTTVLSLIPLCFTKIQIGGDGPPYYPMARAIAGGLFFSTFVTLMILPTIYTLLDDLRNWARRVVKATKN